MAKYHLTRSQCLSDPKIESDELPGMDLPEKAEKHSPVELRAIEKRLEECKAELIRIKTTRPPYPHGGTIFDHTAWSKKHEAWQDSVRKIEGEILRLEYRQMNLGAGGGFSALSELKPSSANKPMNDLDAAAPIHRLALNRNGGFNRAYSPNAQSFPVRDPVAGPSKKTAPPKRAQEGVGVGEGANSACRFTPGDRVAWTFKVQGQTVKQHGIFRGVLPADRSVFEVVPKGIAERKISGKPVSHNVRCLIEMEDPESRYRFYTPTLQLLVETGSLMKPLPPERSASPKVARSGRNEAASTVKKQEQGSPTRATKTANPKIVEHHQPAQSVSTKKGTQPKRGNHPFAQGDHVRWTEYLMGNVQEKYGVVLCRIPAGVDLRKAAKMWMPFPFKVRRPLSSQVRYLVRLKDGSQNTPGEHSLTLVKKKK